MELYQKKNLIIDIQDHESNKLSNISFDKTLKFKLERQGNLFHKLTLFITLPKIQVYYKKLTVLQIINLLLENGIIWNPIYDTSLIFNNNILPEVLSLINSNIDNLNNQILLNNEKKNIINNLNTTNINSIADYKNNLINEFLQLDPLNLIYKFLVANKNDDTYKNIVNSNTLKEIIYTKFLNFVTSNNDLNYTDENLVFLYNTTISNYTFDNSTQQLSASYVFNTGISNQYFGNSYNFLDAYKIFQYILSFNITTFNFNTDQILNDILINIEYGLIKNIKQLTNIYKSINPNVSFYFYKTVNSNSVWNYLSLINQNVLPDNFTSEFTLNPEINEPFGIKHKYSIFTKSQLYIFHTKNSNIIKNIRLLEYFNNVNLFSSVRFLSLSYPFNGIFNTQLNLIFNNNIPLQLNNIYYLNFIPLYTILDIYEALNRVSNSYSFHTSFMFNLDILKLDLINSVLNVLSNSNFQNNHTLLSFVNITELSYQAILNNNEYIEYNGIKHTLIRFIIFRYLEFIDVYYNIELYSETVKNLFINVINTFVTPISLIPTYQNYINNNNNITNLQINSIGNPVLSTAISSIWAYISDSIIDNYNSLYNNNLLNTQTIENEYGIEMLRYITTINTINSIGNNYNYWFNPINPISYLDNETNILYSSIDKYKINIKLLDFRLVFLNNNFYYETYTNILNQYIDSNVESSTTNLSLTYFHQDHGTINDPVIIIKNELLNLYNTPLDIIQYTKTEFIKLVTQSTNPWTFGKKYELWNSLWLPSKSFNTITETNKYTDLFDKFLNTTTLFNNKSIFEKDYEFLNYNINIYDFLINELLKISIVNNIYKLTSNTIEEYKTLLINFYDIDNSNIIKIINNNTNLIPSISNIANVNNYANFSWIENIGHNIIEYIEFKINDQVIDKQTGELINILYNCSKNIFKNEKYNNAIGNNKILTEYNNITKPEYQLIIPLKFWFCEFIEYSIPYDLLIHSDIFINLKLKKLNELIKIDNFTEYKVEPKIKSISLLTNNIYINNKFKTLLVKKKIYENIIFKWNYYNENIISIDDIVKDNTRNYVIKKALNFKGLAKEFFFGIQDINNGNYIDNLKYVTIEFSGSIKESRKEINYYENIIPYEIYNSYLPKGIFCYSFSDDPLNIQPSGFANLNIINNINILIEPDISIINNIQNNNNKYKLIVYLSEYNLLKIKDGLGALF